MKRKLKNYNYLKSRIQQIKEEIQGLRVSQQSLREINAIIPSDMPRSKCNDDKMATAVCKIIDIYENRISNLATELQIKLWELEELTSALWMLDEKEYKVIKERYIDSVRWDFIPGRLSYSRRQCFRLHDNAVRKLIKLLNK